MGSPWLLAVAGGVTLGALFGGWGVGLAALGVALTALPGGRGWLALALAGTLAAGLGAVRVATVDVPPVASAVLASERAEGVVHSIPQSGPSGPRALVRVDRVQTRDGTWVEASGDVLVFFGRYAPERLASGDRVRLRWTASSIEELDAGFGRFVRSSAASATARAFDVTVLSRGDAATGLLVRLRERVTDRIVAAIPGDAGALVAGFVTGDDSGLSDSARDAFDRTNMSHITAVSGSNVAVLLTIWLVLMPTARLRRSFVVLVAIALTIWLYVALVGMSPGAVRAGLFATIMLPAARMGRRADPITALLLASALMLLARPEFADSAGFWLSMAASAAMATCIDRRPSGHGSLVLGGVVALVAAQVATLPVTLAVFGAWSPASLVANLIVGPIVSAFFPFAFAVGLLVTLLPWVGDLIGWLPAIVADVVIAIVRSLADAFPVVRVGAVPRVALALVAALSLAVIATMSADMRRWLRRTAWRAPAAAAFGPAVAVGAGLGAWLVVLAVATWR